MLFFGLFNHKLFSKPNDSEPKCQWIRSSHEGSEASVMAGFGFVVTILQIGMTSFLLSSFKEGWTSISRMKILSPISRLLTSTSIFEGMCSAGQRYLRLVLILFSWPPFWRPGQVSSPLKTIGTSTFNSEPSSAHTNTIFKIFPVSSSLWTLIGRIDPDSRRTEDPEPARIWSCNLVEQKKGSSTDLRMEWICFRSAVSRCFREGDPWMEFFSRSCWLKTTAGILPCALSLVEILLPLHSLGMAWIVW